MSWQGGDTRTPTYCSTTTSLSNIFNFHLFTSPGHSNTRGNDSDGKQNLIYLWFKSERILSLLCFAGEIQHGI